MLNFKLPALVKIFVLAAFFVAAVQASADAATVKVINDTSRTIVACFYRNSGNSDWGNAYLNGHVPSGNTHVLNITGNARYIDLCFRLDNGSYKYVYKMDLSHNYELHVKD